MHHRQIQGQRPTKRENLRDLELHVDPYLGSRPLVEITRKELKAWQDGRLAERCSAKSVSNYRSSIVSPAFRAACREDDDGEPPLRIANPLDGLPQLAHELRAAAEALRMTPGSRAGEGVD